MQNDTVKRILGILAVAIAAGVLIVVVSFSRGKGISENDLSEKGVTARDFAMGSVVTITLYGDSEQTGKEASDTVSRILDLDERVISWRSENSELARWNREAKEGEHMTVSTALSNALNKGMVLWEKSGYVLDLTLRPVLDTWGIEDGDPESFQVPSDQELEEAANRCGMEWIYSSNRELARNREGIVLDLGSIGKGYALDVVYDYLTLGDHGTPAYNVNELRNGRDSVVTGGVIAVGGSVMVFGSKPDGSDFQVGVRDPEGNPEDIIGTLSFRGGTDRHCISTSGGYEKYIEKDGVRYYHIIDPRTLKPADSGLMSVTVVCENGLVSDGLSTACFILGEEESRELLRKYDAEAVFIRSDGSISVTDGLKDAWKLRP